MGIVYVFPARPTSKKSAQGVCENCKRTIIYLPSQTPGRFCSRKCRYDWTKGPQGALARFWAQVDKREKNDCWDWKGSANPDQDYGQFCVNYKNQLAHRYSMELFLGRSLLSSELVLHKCDRPGCVNPRHLFIGSFQDNSNDMMRKGRHRTKIGEDHPGAKLTEKDVIRIRRMASKGYALVDLAVAFGIGSYYVKRIVERKVWRHV